MTSTQNLYQHFCFNRPQHDYKLNFLTALINCFRKFINVSPIVKDNIPSVYHSVGIHIRSNTDDIFHITSSLNRCKQHIEETSRIKYVFIASNRELTYTIAKQIFDVTYTIITNEKVRDEQENELKDLITLTRCKTLYIAWNSNFSRMGAILSPNRDIYCYEHPDSYPDVSKCELDELMSYYKS